MVRISLCMIVKNEEAVLARCLSSAAGIADEIIVVDTGSTDRTKEIAARFTDRIYEYPWHDDFAAARNFAFSKGTGDYLLWLDADDVIPEHQREKLLDLKRRLSADDIGEMVEDDGNASADRWKTSKKTDVVMMKYAIGFDEAGNPVFSFYRERLIRNCPQAVWKGRIHEAIAPFGTVAREDITIEHRKAAVADPGRNLRIYETMIREAGDKGGSFGQTEAVAVSEGGSDGGKVRWRLRTERSSVNDDAGYDCLTTRDVYYYGKELYYHRRYEDAVRVLSRFLERPDGWREDQVDACRHLAICHRQIGDPGCALEALLRGLRYAVPKPELCCDIGAWFLERKRYGEAIFWYRQAISVRKAAGNDGFLQEDYHGYIPCLQLCVCYDRIGQFRRAERCNAMADRLKPGTEACRRNRAYFQGREE